MIKRLPKFIQDHADPLIAAGIDQGFAEVEIILCHLLDCDRLRLYLDGPKRIDENVIAQLGEIVRRRATRYPLQYILEEAWFLGRRFYVNPDVMVPTPETEVLCDSAQRFVQAANLTAPRILDVGTGSGVIAVTTAAEIKSCHVTALDISEAALEVARKNATTHAVSDSIEFRVSDLFGALNNDARFDLILSNPPYIAEADYAGLPQEVLADPKVALTSGGQGLDAIKVILDQAPNYLATGGRLMFEIGYDQSELITEMTNHDSRYQSLTILKDLNNIDRVVILACD